MRAQLAMLFLLPTAAFAEEALVAVATNFQPVLEQLRDDFAAESPHTIRLSSGSTGVLYYQVKNGAPYDAFFAADQSRPKLLEDEGAAVAGSRFSYAEGRLAFWSREPAFIKGSFEASLGNPELRILAIANPGLAPYGHAAKAAITTATAGRGPSGRIVFGENAGQAFALVATGNADAGVIALSSVLSRPDWLQGSYVEVPRELHEPILQDAVLLRRGAENVAAVEFLEYVKRDAVRRKISSFGYW